MENKYMNIALKEAMKSLDVDVPIGAIIIKNNKIIARGYNRKEKKKNAVQHAEIIAIQKACKKLKTWHLEECEMYVTMEPCLMCTGAIVQSRISTVYYGVKNEKFGISNYINIDEKVKINNHYISFYGGYLKEETEKILRNFFKNKRRVKQTNKSSFILLKKKNNLLLFEKKCYNCCSGVMLLYQALYRKYRSENFEQIAGQESIVATLKNAIIHNKISHAYLFSGPRGTGKTSIAKILAKTINCENLNGFLPCNECQSCIQTLHKQNTDIIEIDAASNNGVDEIRELKNKINLVPTYGKYKVYIIDEVHMLTISAFNALLKTLEEPPAHIIFILATTEPHKIPATIISRCQRFDFKRIPEDSIVKRLEFICEKENILYDKEALYEIARLSDGGMRDAISLLDQTHSYAEEKITVKDIHEVNGSVSQYDLKDFFINYCNRDLNYLLKQILKYTDSGKNLVKVTEELVLFLRNVLIYKKVPNFLEENNIPNENYKLVSEKMDTSSLLELVKELNNSIPAMKVSNNPRLNLELTIIKMFELLNNENIQEKTIVFKPNIPENKVQETIISQSIQNSKPIITEQKNISREIKNVISSEKKKLRINNTLATFDKKMLLELREKVKEVKKYLLDSQYSQFVSLILDGSLRASGKKNLIFVFKTNQDTMYFNENLNKIEEILGKVFETVYRVIAVNAEEWEQIKKEFNGKQKEYIYVEEKEEEKKIEQQELDNVQQLFKDIIEYI